MIWTATSGKVAVCSICTSLPYGRRWNWVIVPVNDFPLPLFSQIRKLRRLSSLFIVQKILLLYLLPRSKPAKIKRQLSVTEKRSKGDGVPFYPSSALRMPPFSPFCLTAYVILTWTACFPIVPCFLASCEAVVQFWKGWQPSNVTGYLSDTL